MNEDITAVVDAAQVIIDSTSAPVPTVKPAAIETAIEAGIDAGVEEATKIIQTDEEMKSWQTSLTMGMSEVLTTLRELHSTQQSLCAQLEAPSPPPEGAPVVVPMVETPELEVLNPLEVPELLPEATAGIPSGTEPMVELPIETPLLNPHGNRVRRAASPRKWF